MTSKIQLLLIGRAFGKNATVFSVYNRLKSYADIAEEGETFALPHVVDMFYTGFAQTTHENKPLAVCHSCFGSCREIALPGCKIAGCHDDKSTLRYSRSKFGPRTYNVGEDGLRPEWVTDLQNASRRKSIEKSRGIGELEGHDKHRSFDGTGHSKT